MALVLRLSDAHDSETPIVVLPGILDAWIAVAAKSAMTRKALETCTERNSIISATRMVLYN